MHQGFLAYDLAVSLYRKVESIPGKASLRDQLTRAAESVVLNIAEGSGRKTKADQARFYTIAFGSIREVKAALDLLNVQESELLDRVDHVAACLYRLIHPRQ